MKYEFTYVDYLKYDLNERQMVSITILYCIMVAISVLGGAFIIQGIHMLRDPKKTAHTPSSHAGHVLSNLLKEEVTVK
jgi:hypothetical protein